ncbi:MAG: hypothetical protein A3G49_02025 [Candidatus Sungbacteria bacterium RIFCSPLOWO2_12_FULL_41_11]|uniref:M23ase beta-sheet core domain-containing protein n=1 Tax=Candidatus Sungbacteria bacterium RIFCSPLOWO2_12_FULL_41_11 TaxID=1802286 RepID=A0A1G2LU90_9BACT|nr:MAG: Peptidase M23 [Parcubacteria group bacterium GW2011_GWA2_42_14]OHA00097.1 MAG: hypothetical protein A3D41_00490 [Candidatus Sungbacteria bacterium RIFCSPHIGHO2_02_FULL_41_12b]OHA14381.1 MAG: hypothetical protein A3G49_02025 [Candidatus Sungbacteria bacterium RIFCSPLOWO2_12_FULL_41_11]
MRPVLKKRFIPFTAIILMVFTAFYFKAGASTIDDLKKEIEAKNQEIQKLEEQEKQFKQSITETQKTSKTLANQVASIEKSIKNINSEVRINEAKIARANLEIKVLREEISAKENEILSGKQGMAGIFRLIYEKDKEGYYAMFIKNSSLSSLLTRFNEFTLIQNKFKEYLSGLKSLKAELESKKTSEEDKKNELAGLQGVLGDKKVLQAVQQKEKTQILTSTKNQEKLYQQLLKKTEAKEEEILKELEELEDRLRVLIDPSSLPLSIKGFFNQPADGRISQFYGRTSFAVRSDFYKFHNGIDIANVYGTPIVSAYPGKVIYIGNTDNYCPRGAYGKYVLVDHENNLATFYTHLSLIKVGVGDRLEKGQLIGYMGRSGLTTGSHVHFTVYDSRTVEVKQSRVCGPMPYGGSIDPMDYL